MEWRHGLPLSWPRWTRRPGALVRSYSAVPPAKTTLDMPPPDQPAAFGASFASGHGRIETAGGGARARTGARRHDAWPRHRLDGKAFRRVAGRTGARRPQGDRRADLGSDPRRRAPLR